MTTSLSETERDVVAPAPPGGRPPAVGMTELARWAWRSLTSMRTALLLLLLLALGAIPGSLLPQVRVDPGKVNAFRRMNPTVSSWLDRLSLFDVFASPWFAAIYLLLLTSLTGCVLPRAARLWRVLRAAPPPAPRHLDRMPSRIRWSTDTAPGPALATAARHLTRRGFRVVVREDTVSAEKGYLRETGNMLFHLSLLVLLVGVALGSLYGFHGRVLVAEGGTFSNTATQYDDLVPGSRVDNTMLTPFSFQLRRFTVRFESAGPQRGAPRAFVARLRYRTAPDAPWLPKTVRVNHPLNLSRTKVFLTGNGYAPRFTVRDGEGRVVYSGPVNFLPRDGFFTSEGAIKIPGAEPEQLGFSGVLLPTAAMGENGPYSAFPDLLNPRVLLTAYSGDLGLDTGRPQSVFKLDTSGLTQFQERGQPFIRALSIGETMTLPRGAGSLTFDGVARFANFQIAYDPGKEISLAALVLLLTGLMASLAIRQRRVWARVRPTGTGTTIEIAGLTRRHESALEADLRRLGQALDSPADRGDRRHPPSDPTPPAEPTEG